MTHEEMAELYELYALGVLDPHERAEIDQHLADKCPECTTCVHRALDLGGLLGMTATMAEPPRRLRRRVLAIAGVETKGSGYWIGGLAFASAALLTVAVLFWTQTQKAAGELANTRAELGRTTTDLSRLQTIMQFLNQPGTKEVTFKAAQPSGRVFANPTRGVLLIANNLPQVPAGKLFELWLLPTTGAPVPAGLFRADAQGNVLYMRQSGYDPANTKGVAVTIEPEAGSTTPTMPILFAASLSD